MQTSSIPVTRQQRLDILNNQFSIVTALMNTRQSILISGGGVILRIRADGPYYDKIKAFLSDIGCDIAAEMLMVRESIETAISG